MLLFLFLRRDTFLAHALDKRAQPPRRVQRTVTRARLTHVASRCTSSARTPPPELLQICRLRKRNRPRPGVARHPRRGSLRLHGKRTLTGRAFDQRSPPVAGVRARGPDHGLIQSQDRDGSEGWTNTTWSASSPPTPLTHGRSAESRGYSALAVAGRIALALNAPLNGAPATSPRPSARQRSRADEQRHSVEGPDASTNPTRRINAHGSAEIARSLRAGAMTGERERPREALATSQLDCLDVPAA